MAFHPMIEKACINNLSVKKRRHASIIQKDNDEVIMISSMACICHTKQSHGSSLEEEYELTLVAETPIAS